MTTLRFSTTDLLLRAYDLLWKVIAPLSRNHRRLKEGYDQRILTRHPLPASTIWIHAASAGEAYIATELARALHGPQAPSILISTHTRQGLEVLKKNQAPHTINRYTPFDAPRLMERAFTQVAPRLLVLIELELWPGMLATAKKRGVPIAVVNGRLTPSSFKGYARARRLLAPLAPDFISAISADDASRLADLFPKSPLVITSNIKFDRIPASMASKKNTPPLIGAETRTIYLLASVREEEEEAVLEMAEAILARDREALIAWFPRHMERVAPLCRILADKKIAHQRRSQNRTIDTTLSLIVWDQFGEMGEAFAQADAAFVGGSFAPLGGQNMLEPLASGLIPVMGPSYSNFSWVGDDLKKAGLLILCDTPSSAATHLMRLAAKRGDRDEIFQLFQRCIESHRGGTKKIRNHLIRLLKG